MLPCMNFSLVVRSSVSEQTLFSRQCSYFKEWGQNSVRKGCRERFTTYNHNESSLQTFKALGFVCATGCLEVMMACQTIFHGIEQGKSSFSLLAGEDEEVLEVATNFILPWPVQDIQAEHANVNTVLDHLLVQRMWSGLPVFAWTIVTRFQLTVETPNGPSDLDIQHIIPKVRFNTSIVCMALCWDCHIQETSEPNHGNETTSHETSTMTLP